MASKIEKLDNNEEKITFEIAQEQFAEAMQKVFQKNKQRFNIPGFRKGKAPFSIVMNYYGEGMFYEDALDLILEDAYQAVLKENEVKTYSSPKMDVEEIGLDKGVKVSAIYAAKPQVTLGDYTGLSAYRPPVEIEDSEIDNILEEERFKISRMVPVERPIQEGDFVLMDYEGSVDGIPFEGGQASDYELEIGSGQFIPGFEEQLIGHSKDEEFDIDVTFPAEYHEKDLAGAEAVFHIKVSEVKEREMPELDDEFIKDISEDCDTLEEYRKVLREKLEKEHNGKADEEFENNLMAQVVENSQLAYSDLILRDEMRNEYMSFAQNIANYGMHMQDFLRSMGMTEAQYMERLREPARQKLETSLVAEALADKENLSATEEDIQAEMQRLADSYGMDVEKLEELYAGTDGAKESLEQNLRLRQAFKYLGSISEATDELPDDELKADNSAEEESAALADEAEDATDEESKAQTE